MSENNFTFKEPEVLNHPQSEMIFIQKRDLELRLIDFKDNVSKENEATSNPGDWLALFALVIVPFTTTFKGFLGVSAESIKVIYCAIVIIVGIFFLGKIHSLVKHWWMEKTVANSPDPRKYVIEIKNSCNAVLPMNSKKPPRIKKH